MKRIFFVLSALIAILIIAAFSYFFYFNKEEVTVDYIIGMTTMNVSVFLLIAFISGVVCTLILMMFGEMALSWKISTQKSEIKRLKARIEELQKR